MIHLIHDTVQYVATYGTGIIPGMIPVYLVYCTVFNGWGVVYCIGSDGSLVVKDCVSCLGAQCTRT